MILELAVFFPEHSI